MAIYIRVIASYLSFGAKSWGYRFTHLLTGIPLCSLKKRACAQIMLLFLSFFFFLQGSCESNNSFSGTELSLYYWYCRCFYWYDCCYWKTLILSYYKWTYRLYILLQQGAFGQTSLSRKKRLVDRQWTECFL